MSFVQFLLVVVVWLKIRINDIKSKRDINVFGVVVWLKIRINDIGELDLDAMVHVVVWLKIRINDISSRAKSF